MLGPGTAPAVNDNALYAMSYLMDNYGLSAEQAAGVVGNFQQESYRDLQTSVRGDGGQAVGIGQWWPDRAANLQSFAAAQGRDWSDIDTQLDFAMHEMGVTDRFGRGSGYAAEARAGRDLLAANDVREATRAVAGYERARGYSRSNPEGIHGWGNRYSNAQALLSGNTGGRYAYAASGTQTGAQRAAGDMATGQGVRGDPDVFQLQQVLAKAGYDPGPLDGIMGPRTEAAMQAYQSAAGPAGARGPALGLMDSRPSSLAFGTNNRTGAGLGLANQIPGAARTTPQWTPAQGQQQGAGPRPPIQLPEWLPAPARAALSPLMGGAGRALVNAFSGGFLNRFGPAPQGASQAPARGGPLSYAPAGGDARPGVPAAPQMPSWATGLGLANAAMRSDPGGRAYVTGTAPGGSPVAGYQGGGQTWAWHTGPAPMSSGYGGAPGNEYGLANNVAYQPGGGAHGLGLLGSVLGFLR